MKLFITWCKITDWSKAISNAEYGESSDKLTAVGAISNTSFLNHSPTNSNIAITETFYNIINGEIDYFTQFTHTPTWANI